MRRSNRLAALALLLAAGAAAAQEAPDPAALKGGDLAGPERVEPAPAPLPPERTDSSQYEVALPAYAGWNASLIYDNDVGIWTVESFDIIDEYGCPEVVGLDDKGRCTILSCYSGKWAREDTIGEHKWLGGLEHVDLDPTVPGRELYTGGQRGNLYQVVSEDRGVWTSRFLTGLPGLEIHTLVAGDLQPEREGNEMFVFTRPGGLFLATFDPEGGFRLRNLGEVDGRVRDAVLLPHRPGEVPSVACVSRNGKVRLVRMGAEGPEWTVIAERKMGFGRLSLSPASTPDRVVFYTGCDDGVLLRHEGVPGGRWSTETIYAGPQGLRGVVAGRFSEDPERETVATFGYSGKVQLLTRGADGWSAETIFVDRDKGHWLARAEVDGRNGTDELVGSGYGKRVFLLVRPAGYGRPGLAVDPADEDLPRSWEVK